MGTHVVATTRVARAMGLLKPPILLFVGDLAPKGLGTV